MAAIRHAVAELIHSDYRQHCRLARNGTNVARRVELTRSELALRTVGPGALLPYGADREGQLREGHDPFAKLPATDRFLRTPAVQSGRS